MAASETMTGTPQLVVQVVDDALETLGFLTLALERAGYLVLAARSGQAALDSLALVNPDAILLDAMMPGIDGFETCRRIKQLPAQAHVPVIFMTALSDTDHIVAGFAAGGVDYVVKPIKTDEVLARLATHVRNARVSRLTQQAADLWGLGVVLLDARDRIAWQSPQAAQWLPQFLPHEEAGYALGRWLRQSQHTPALALGGSNGKELAVHWAGASGLGETLLLLYVRPATAALARAASLTQREAEVLSWVAKGKTNRDIGDILGLSPRTVNKHLEHIYTKLGVETRTSAIAAIATPAITRPLMS